MENDELVQNMLLELRRGELKQFKGERDFREKFEKALHAKVMKLEREIVREELERADIDAPAIAWADYLAASYPTVDVLVYDGGQDRYPVLFGVE